MLVSLQFCLKKKNIIDKQFCGILSLTSLGLVRYLNPGPLAPLARIIPLGQRAVSQCINFSIFMLFDLLIGIVHSLIFNFTKQYIEGSKKNKFTQFFHSFYSPTECNFHISRIFTVFIWCPTRNVSKEVALQLLFTQTSYQIPISSGPQAIFVNIFFL